MLVVVNCAFYADCCLLVLGLLLAICCLAVVLYCPLLTVVGVLVGFCWLLCVVLLLLLLLMLSMS